MSDQQMAINLTVPAGDYVLIRQSDLGRLVSMLKSEGVYTRFQLLDVKAIPIKYVPPDPEPITLTDAQRETLAELVSNDVVPLYDGKKPLKNHGYNRNTLRALVNKGLLEEREVEREGKGPIRTKGSLVGYFVTDPGREAVSEG